MFLRVRNHWFYKDLGSTNGSWLNGNQLAANTWRLVRPGDYLQLADAALKLEGAGEGLQTGINDFANLGGRSLLIFLGNQFRDEFPVPEFGRALVVGGSEADLPVSGDVSELPSLVVERRGDKMVAYNVSKQLPLFLNGVDVRNETATLGDGDALQVDNVLVIVNDPNQSRGPVPKSSAKKPDEFSSVSGQVHGGVSLAQTGQGAISNWGAKDSARRQWETPARADYERRQEIAGTGTFGSIEGLDNGLTAPETMAIDTDEIEMLSTRSELHPSMRHLSFEEAPQYSFSSAEDKIIIFIGFLLMLLLILLLVWWVFI